MSTERTRQETASAYAAHLKERFETKGILRELAGYPNFVVWQYKVENGQRKKPPVNPMTHRPASPADRATWGTLASALSAVATGNYQGIGFMLSRRSSRSWTPTLSIHRHGTEQPVQAASTYLLRGNRQQVKKQGILKCTGKSTTLPSPPGTSQDHP